jgi:uncharacterized membrane protein YgdD (TMEM256/DUF423 family)
LRLFVNRWLAVAALNGALAVAAGAFAAHGLQGQLDSHALAIFETGARYHMYHALALGLAALAARSESSRHATISAWLFLAGIVLFSGSLYALALTRAAIFGYVTPLGGVALLAGWLALAWAALRK